MILYLFEFKYNVTLIYLFIYFFNNKAILIKLFLAKFFDNIYIYF